MRLNTWKLVLVLGNICLFLWMGQLPAQAQVWGDGCSYRRSITIDHTKVPNTDQTNFPVLISGTYSYLATTANGGNVTNSNGYDILFASDANGVNPLSFEQEGYNAATGAIIYWVKVPTVSHTTDTVIYMFYGNSSISTDQSNKTTVWDSGYKGVWHLPNGTTLTALDSTSNGNNGVNHGATASAGQIDGAASVNSGTYIDVGSNLDVSGTKAFTGSAWVKPNGSFYGGWPLISGAKNQQVSIGFINTTTRPYVTFHYSGGFRDLDSGLTASTGTWYHIVGTYDGTTEKIYVNGSLQASVSVSDSITNGNTDTAVIGKNIDNSAYLNATIDETRFSNIARSADWVATEYNNQNSPYTFYSIGSSSQGTMTLQITGLNPSNANFGDSVLVEGTNFGGSQGASAITLNGASLVVQGWGSDGIDVLVPYGASTGYISVTVNGQTALSPLLTVKSLPSGWSDANADIGSVGTAGSDSYSNGVFTVKGAGQGVVGGYTTDALHFVYEPLSGDGTIVARLASLSQGGQAGVMIRETLNQSSTHADALDYSGRVYFTYRTSTGGSNSDSGYNSGNSLPVWMKVVRSGSSFSSYWSPDGLSWYQVGTSQTISMAQNVYIGLAVSGNQGLATATFDSVSISSSSLTPPVITSASASTGSVGSQLTISGTGFGASQSGSLVTLNDVPVSIDSWSNTSIIVTIPSGATSGPLLVSLAPSMNNSNPVEFTVTSQPMPSPWLGQDVGLVGTAGSATYSSGTFSVSGAGLGILSSYTTDAFYFAYQPLSGDGSIVARVASTPSTSTYAGVMIRETLDQSSTHAYTAKNGGTDHFIYRTSSGGSNSNQGDSDHTMPIWVMLVRAGNAFTGYSSDDGVNWSQIYTAQTINMAQNVYIGLAVSSQNTSAVATATFDNVTVTEGTTPFVTAVSPSLGPTGTSVTITGSNFGSSKGSSTVSFNGVQASSVTSWSSSQIVATVASTTPAGAGPVTVTVGSATSPGTETFTTIKPAITSLTPPAAQVGGQITISGTGFGSSQGSSSVQFNGVSATVNSWSATSITATVPTGATSGPVSVVEDGVTSNGAQFTLLEALTITGISPSAASAGGSVTITGTGFGATQSNSSAVFYLSQPASVTSWSDTQIVAAVPSQALSGSVGVCVATLCTWGPTFTITQNVSLSDSLSNQTTYSSSMVGGQWVPYSTQGSGCTTCSLRGTVSNTYDSNGNVLSRTDENGHTTTYTYDSNNNVLTVTAPISATASATTSYTYNSFGEVLTTTDPLGNVTTNTYDSKGNLLTVTTPAPNGNTAASVTTFTYNTLGELLTIKDPLQNVTTLTYYPTGLINTITDAQSNLTTYTYDSLGNRTSVKDANNQTTAFTYDTTNMGRLMKITYPDSTTTQFGYDYRGRRTSVTDQNSKTTTYAYDDADRLTTVTDAANNVTTYGYDTENNLTSIEDANNNTTSFSYDAFGRVTQTLFPSGLYESYGYDGIGNLTSKTDRKSQYITYTYDQLNRLTEKSYPDSSTVNYSYDNDSRLTQVTDATGTYQFTFDNMGRLTGTSTSYAFLTGRSFATSYSYDAASNRTGFTDPESGSTSYVYDTLNRLQTLTPPSAISGTFGFGYDALSRRTSLTRPNSVNTSYTYDNLSRLLSVTHAISGTTLDGASYGLDNAGNRNSRTPQPSGTASSYTYDNIYELTGVTQGGSTTESYTYDPVGNRQTSLGVSSYSNNTSNELTSTSNATYTYDYNGNTLTKVVGSNTTSYSWDYENRMTSVTLPGSGGTVSFKYDAFGRRIYKSSSSATSIYAFDGDNLVEETNSSGTAVARYADGLNIDEPLAMLRSSATSFYHADGLGSITSLSNGSGSIAQTYSFDSFGNLTGSSGSLTNPFQYTARESDTETGLYYYRARYYDSGVGRFLSEDPFDSPVYRNRFRYVRNNAPNRVDSSGMRDHPYPHRGCELVGVLRLMLYTSETDQEGYGDWSFVYSYQEGAGDAPYGFLFGAPFASVACVWQRAETAELWGHVLTTYRYKCWKDDCLGHHEWTDIRFKWSEEDLGRHPSAFKERMTTHFDELGVEDETNDILCVIKARP